MEGIFKTENNAFKCNISMAYVLYTPIYEKDENHKSNEKKLIKFDNYDDNLCFWRCLAVFDELINQSGGKIDMTVSKNQLKIYL